MRRRAFIRDTLQHLVGVGYEALQPHGDGCIVNELRFLWAAAFAAATSSPRWTDIDVIRQLDKLHAM